MKAVRKNSVVVEPLKDSNENAMGIITTGFGFNEGKVISSAFEGVQEGDIVIYDDSLTVGEYKVVFEANLIAIK
jgi:hypothetical protein